MNTNWSTPKRTYIAGLLSLRKALKYGHNAVLIKAKNEDCNYPITEKHANEDFRNYRFSIGYISSRYSIMHDNNLTDVEKALSLNFKTCYGTKEAVKKYYETGEVSDDNFKGMGMAHLVHHKDIIEHLTKTHRYEETESVRRKFITGNENDKHFFDFYRYNLPRPYAIKKFKRKLWVVNLPDKTQPVKIPLIIKFINVLFYPAKFIPKYSKLNCKSYTQHSFRLGSYKNGYKIDFHIPKKFSFS